MLAAADVVMAPTINYHFYPSFVEYPGSTHLQFNTARDVVVDIVRSLASYGPQALLRPQHRRLDRPAPQGRRRLPRRARHRAALHQRGGSRQDAEEQVRQQARGTHADEIETSMMLYIAPGRVDMSKAVKDDRPDQPGRLTRQPDGPGLYSPSGVWGDATLATREKGRVVVEATVTGILAELAALRRAPLPK